MNMRLFPFLGFALIRSGVSSSFVGERLTTSECPAFRVGRFQARLDLYYFYLVETSPSVGDPDLLQTEKVIGRHVVEALNECDSVSGQPLAAVKLTGGHAYSYGGNCVAQYEGNICRVVRGLTSVLLDSDPSRAEEDATAAIEEALTTGLDTILIRSQFIQQIGQNLVILDDYDYLTPASNRTSVVMVAMVSTVTAFLLAGAFVYGIRRRGVTRALKLRLDHEQAKHRHYFGPLDEEAIQEPVETREWTLSPGEFQATQNGPSVTWSVSDLTSDSHSIKSSLKMDRIAEEDADSDPDEVESDPEFQSNGRGDSASTSPEPSMNVLPVHNQHDLEFVAKWAQGEESSGEIYCTASENTNTPMLDGSCAATPVRRNRIKDYDVPEELVGGNLENSMESSEASAAEGMVFSMSDMFPRDGRPQVLRELQTVQQRAGKADLTSPLGPKDVNVAPLSIECSDKENIGVGNGSGGDNKNDLSPSTQATEVRATTDPVLVAWSQNLLTLLQHINDLKALPSP